MKRNLCFCCTFVAVMILNISVLTAQNINIILDSLQKKYVPDKRISLWNQYRSDKDTSLIFIEVSDKNIADSLRKNFIDEQKILIKLLPEQNYDQTVNAIITNSVASLRTHPKHSAEMATQAIFGTPVRILKEQNGWYLIQTPNKYIAWGTKSDVIPFSAKQIEEYKHLKKVVYTKQCGFTYSSPSQKSLIVSDMVAGSIIPVIDSVKDYYKIRYPDERIGFVKKTQVVDIQKFINRKPDTINIVETALKFNGIPYMWGGMSSKAIDCSGLSSMVYFLNGMILLRDASQQTYHGEIIDTVLSYRKLKPGDLIFFGTKTNNHEKVTHVAIYIGNSQIIHASGKVRINSLDKNADNFIYDYENRFIRSVRIIGKLDKTGFWPIKEDEFYKQIISF